MKYELVVIYEYPQEKVVYEYDSQEQAEQAEKGMRTALGNQIAWSCTRPKM